MPCVCVERVIIPFVSLTANQSPLDRVKGSPSFVAAKYHSANPLLSNAEECTIAFACLQVSSSKRFSRAFLPARKAV